MGALIALMVAGMAFQAAVSEGQTPSGDASQPAVQAEPAPQPASEAQPVAAASTGEQPSPEPEAEPAAVSEAVAFPEPDEQLPSGGPAPSVTVRADRDIGGLRIGDTLTLTCELDGFSGMQTSIHWQARESDQWKDLPGEHSARLIIDITSDNATWDYRAAVDAQPVH